MVVPGQTLIPEQTLAETERRYREREVPRSTQVEKVAAGAILNADSPDRVQRRLERLARSGPTTESTLGVALERILGKNDLVSVSYLDQALRVSRTVARVQIRSSTGQMLGSGSGFLVSPRLLLTNNHVLEDRSGAAFSRAEMNFQDGIDGAPLPSIVFDLEPNRFFLTDQALDYTLVAVRERSRDGGEPLSFGWNRLIETTGKVIVGEFLNIIQHPNGERKQLALRENQLVDVLDTFLHYQTDTAPGSSGSPVFNDQWEVVALHHSGVPRRDSEGRILARDGTPWTPDMGEQQIDWIANEGVRISQILRHVRAQPLSGEEARLRDEMLAVPPVESDGSAPGPASVRSLSADAPQATGSGPIVGADGSAVWTVPIQISVRIGPDGPDGETIVQTPLTQSAPPAPPSQNGQDAPQTDSSELYQALALLEAARTRPYYDEVADAQDRDDYYAQLDRTLGKDDLYRQISALLETTHTTRPRYKPAQHVYPVVDLHPDGNLRSIYSGEVMNAAETIRADFQIEAQRERVRELMLSGAATGRALVAAELSLLEATMPFNCEHVVPQSYFGEREPMRGDLHHLFACEMTCNSFRSNIPYFDFPDFMEAERTKCGKRVENRFEPEAGKGAVARATLYFLLRYPGEINRTAREYEEDRLATLIAWHNTHPVTRYERHRNAEIRKQQGNRNPLIDVPELADAINFALGLG